MRKHTVIDLFCGCGGFSKGFENAGFEVKLGIDSWKDAALTYKHNFQYAVVINDDITTVTGNTILSTLKIKKNEIDVIIGGPPCQGFSVSGKRMLDDPRNFLYKSFINIVKEVEPKVFILENVPGLIRLFKGKVKEEIINDFTKIGYSVNMKLLSADDFGVPQVRKRIFFVGINKSKIKNSTDFNFPLPNIDSEDKITCKQAISDLDFLKDDIVGKNSIDYAIPTETYYQDIMRKNSNKLLNHVITMHKPRTKEIIDLVPDGGNYKSLPVHLQDIRRVNIAWTRMSSKRPCFTIDTGHNHHFHYRANRVPTVRESARIQSFPDNFEFLGIKTSQLKQVGNAVPPLLAQALANEIYKILEKG